MKFVILTDTHFVARGRKLYGLDPTERLGAAVDRINRDHPDVQIVVAAIDRGLNERGFIVPGLGDAGDRLYGTK